MAAVQKGGAALPKRTLHRRSPGLKWVGYLSFGVREWFISPHGARVKPSIFAPSINRRAAIPRQLSNRFTDDRTGPAECEGIANSVRIGRARAQPGVTSRSHSGSSSSMLIVGGTIPRSDRLDDGDQLERTTRTQRVAVH